MRHHFSPVMVRQALVVQRQLDYYKSVVMVAEALSMLLERFAGNQYCFERDRYHDKRTIFIGHYLITSSGANGSY
ncbi:hypothetical protein EC036_24800 [Enterobacter cloacae]|nr:hypothetical protein EC036_24800 [Enterobacter cloacae]